ncbi:MAG: DNA polymerase III subunit gamma/tau [Bacteroidota bacterium]
MSDFVVSARKYRPALFTDVVGQEHVTLTLKNALRSNHLAHAFLFCGPRGVGKTTCARILAKVINCQQPTSDHEPCLVCASCRSFNDNASFNITELDAASNNTVEHIRSLIDQVRFQPQQGKYKVFIIDEVHMLSSSAFNAFLKTLEEPPAHAIFILATTEKHKILPTIISRCQIYEFRRIQPISIVPHLKAICQKESIHAEEEALHIIAQKADGALRDALSIFDRMVAFSGNEIKYADVIENLNVLDVDYYFQMVDYFLAEDRLNILLLFDEVLKKGFDEDLFINGLATHVRNILVSKDVQTLQLLEVTGTLRDRYRQQAALASASFLLTVLNLANECDLNAKMAKNKRLHVEIALLKMAHLNRILTLPPENTAFSEEKKKPEPIVKPEVTEKIIKPEIAPVSPKSNVVPDPDGGSSLLKRLMREIKEEEKTGDNQVAIPLTQEALNAFWESYVLNIQQDSTRNLLKTVSLEWESELTIKAVTASSLQESTMKQEKAMMDKLRAHFHRPDLTFQIVLVKNESNDAPVLPNRPPSAREIWSRFNAINPAIKEFAARLSLRLEED